jgi:uncharacterized protein YcnI
MRRTLTSAALLTFAAGVSLSAHIIVSPLQSKSGATQKYELRVHNEAKVATKSIDLDVPDGVTITDVAKPAAGTVTTKKTGDRITTITWQVEVAPQKYLAFPFTAQNPPGAAELHWNMHEHLTDGTSVDWTDKPGSKEKGSITKLTAP